MTGKGWTDSVCLAAGDRGYGSLVLCISAYMIITKDLLDELSSEAKSSARLRMLSTFGRFACQRTTTATSP